MAALLAAMFCSAIPARGAGRVECRVIHSGILGREVPYCVLLPPSYDAEKTRRYPVVYFLHGLGDNEQMFVHSGAWNMTEDLWEQKRMGEFVIATPDGGRSFYINSRDGRVRYGDFLLREFLPFIEKTYRIRAGRSTRGIAGISMGGYGALHLAFQHPELFAAVSVESAVLIEKLPRVTVSGGGEPGEVDLLGDVFGSPLDRAFWDRNNPLTLARTANLSGLKIYFNCGSSDDYGFNAGAEALDRELTARGIPHEFHLYPGGHSWSYFADHLPATLEFQSQAFGLQTSPN
jgi:S-formylglutathione hydrolase FrmB